MHVGIEITASSCSPNPDSIWNLHVVVQSISSGSKKFRVMLRPDVVLIGKDT